MSLFEKPSLDRLKNTDRILVLKVKEGSKVLSSTGLVDKRLFTGENKLHAVRSDIDGLWYLKYEQGAVPAQLKVRFTSFSKLKKFASEYLATRNIEIAEVID